MKKSEKVKVIIDSDVMNEIDDQFAICYALARQNTLDVLAITIEPFRVHWRQNLSVHDSLIESRNETNRILNLFGIKHSQESPFVFMGCDGFISEGYDSTNPAVEKIIEVATLNDQVTICCLGTLTNVAQALRIDPSISKKIKVVWLGTGNILMDKFDDSNFRKDKEAFNIVLASDVDFTIFPSYMARCFTTSIYEFANNTQANNVVKYLQTLLNRSEFAEKDMGIKEIYDIGPVAYILNPDQFLVKEIDGSWLAKEGGVKVPKGRKVNYIVAIPQHFEIWRDFIAAVNSVKNHYLKPQIFFTSDTHFNHDRKVKFKQVPFKTVEEMNKELVRRWNATVAPNDTVYHLGDFGDYDFIKQLHGKVILICGNYEKKDYTNFEQFRKKLKKLGFAEVYENGIYADEKMFGMNKKVFLTHKPTDCDKTCLNLFGHVHSLKGVTTYGVNVACNYHYFAPMTLASAKRYLDFVEHYADQDVFE